MSEISEKNDSPRPKRLGLSLSGGGFRASFFHIGVLAKMAELGLLRYVEVISTVSGGAIIGTLYYLHLKKLLENKSDSQVLDSDYCQILQKITEDFLKAVQSNIIMTAYNNPLKTIKMALDNYSSSLRLAELYEQYFYRPVFNPNETAPIKMSELKIMPKGDLDFYPLEHNIHRSAKVPILLINTTSLNTGRNWYFEATHMGEAPRESIASQEIDKNLRLVRPNSYDLLDKEHEDFLLSHAVAASAALPAVFAPIKISHLYPNEIDLRLVDGGVHDNQGIEGLLNFDCTDFIISDASRPLEFEAKPNIGNEGLLLRVRSILGDRLREEQIYRMLEGKYKNHTAFMHLRKNFSIIKQGYLTLASKAKKLKPLTSISDFTLSNSNIGIAPEVQQSLARIRTHLDSFTDLEAYSLMFYGYQISQQVILNTPSLNQIAKQEQLNINWEFLKIAPWAKQPTPNYLHQLKVGSERFLKIFQLNPLVKRISLLVLFLIFLLTVWSLFSFLSILSSFSEVQELLAIPLNQAISIFSPIVIILFLLRVVFARRYSLIRELWFNFWAKALLPALCFPLVWLHLLFYDKLFLKAGQLDQLEKPLYQNDLNTLTNVDQQLESQ